MLFRTLKRIVHVFRINMRTCHLIFYGPQIFNLIKFSDVSNILAFHFKWAIENNLGSKIPTNSKVVLRFKSKENKNRNSFLDTPPAEKNILRKSVMKLGKKKLRRNLLHRLQFR